MQLSDDEREFLEREKAATGVGYADLLHRLLHDYRQEPPIIRAMRRDRSLTREDRVALWELQLKRERKRRK